MSQEDQLAKAEMKNSRYDQHRLEVPYNHYGSRGVVDFVGEQEDTNHREIIAIEFKSASAVKSSTGANEIIRQFNRQVEYLTKGTDYGGYNDIVVHQLAFHANAKTVQHLHENLPLYVSVQEQHDNARVLMKHPDCGMPFVVREQGIIAQVGTNDVIEAEGIDRELLVDYS